MAVMRAVKVAGKGVLLEEAVVPTPGESEVLVKAEVVALNPVDYKTYEIGGAPQGAIAGNDVAGTVEKVGSKVTSVKVGDRIASFVYGSSTVNPDNGAFAEHVVVQPEVAVKIPDSWSFEQAAYLGLATVTVGQSLFEALGFPIPSTPGLCKGKPILIWNASGSVGQLAVQLAHISGMEIYAVCSSKKFDFIKSLGATYLYDYKDPQTIARIREDSEDQLKYGLDAYSTDGSQTTVAQALGQPGSLLCGLDPFNGPLPDNVRYTSTLAFTAFGRPIRFLGKLDVPASPKDHKVATEMSIAVAKYLADGRIKPVPYQIIEGGLAGISQGLGEMESGQLRGNGKLVARIADTR